MATRLTLTQETEGSTPSLAAISLNTGRPVAQLAEHTVDNRVAGSSNLPGPIEIARRERRARTFQYSFVCLQVKNSGGEAQMAERSIVDREVAGSSPVAPASLGSVAQRQSIRLLSEGLRVQVSPDPPMDCGLWIVDWEPL